MKLVGTLNKYEFHFVYFRLENLGNFILIENFIWYRNRLKELEVEINFYLLSLQKAKAKNQQQKY